jgi:hypothetical protein
MFEGFGSMVGSYLSDYHTQWTASNFAFPGSPAVGRRSGYGMQISTSLTAYAEYDIESEYSSLIVGFAIKPPTGGTPNGAFMEFRDSSDTVQFVVDLTAAGRVRVKSATGGSVLVESSDGAISFDVYQYFEIKCTVSSSGTIQVRVDGADVIPATGSLNTQQAGSGGAQKLVWHSWSNGVSTDYDDLYLCDTGGASFNDFLGDIKVDPVFPDADGNYSQFTPSTGTDHYDVIDDVGPTGDDEYNEAATVGYRDSFDITPAGDLPTIYAVKLRSVSRNPDTGVAEGTPFVRMGGIDYDQSAFTRGDSFEYDDTIMTARPDTGGPWTKTVLLSTEIGWQFSNAS